MIKNQDNCTLPFEEYGYIWTNCPYIIWLIYSIVCVGPFVIIMTPYFTIKKIAQSIYIMCTLKDGEAKAKLQEMWDTPYDKQLKEDKCLNHHQHN
jgi:hypothetical protein